MKRIVILIVIVVLGGVAALLYTLFPPPPVQLDIAVGEDGDIIQPDSRQSETDRFESESEPAEENTGISFGLPGGMYNEDIAVELLYPEGAEVRFTTDGSDPTAKSTIYTEPIEINAGSKVKASTVRAAVVKDGQIGRIYTQSYITGADVYDRFDENTLIFVLSTDPYNLYDYEYGIAVPGKIYDDYVAEHPGEEIPYNAPGNYYMSGRESERDMYVEVFESSGKQVISQAAGVRVVGGYSRVVSQKSLKLIARKEYDPENGKFKYAFFDGAVTADGVPITEYDRIVLRNGANDREFAGVRDELSQQLARDYGYPTTQHTTPCAVFLNGEYYGYSWLHENYNEDYLETMFGGSKENYEIIQNTEIPEEGSERALADYGKVVEYFEKDLTDDKIFAELCELVDIENFMQYYAMQIFISNKDWPGNNYKIYRYYPTEGEEITSEYMDGRWRYLFFDAEFGWGLYGDGFRLNTISDLLSGEHMSGKSEALEALLKREDMRAMLVTTLCDMWSGAFSEENILSELEYLISISDSEQFYALDHGVTSDWANRNSFEESREQIRQFAAGRERVLKKQIVKLFDIYNVYYDVKLTGSAGASAKLNTLCAEGGTLTSTYFSAYGVEISAEPYRGYRFVKWVINGEDYTEPVVKLDYSMCDVNRQIDCRLVVEREEVHGQPLTVKCISTDKNAGWITLYNPNAETVSTKGLHISDDENDLTRFSIPAVDVAPYTELTIVMKNNKNSDSLMKIQATFSLKHGETLYLTDSEGNILEAVVVPEIGEGRVYVRGENGKFSVK